MIADAERFAEPHSRRRPETRGAPGVSLPVRRAAVSRSFIYDHPELRAKIAHRAAQVADQNARFTTSTRVTTASLRANLETEHAGVVRQSHRIAGLPFGPPGLPPILFRSDFGAELPSLPERCGRENFFEFAFNRAASSATYAPQLLDPCVPLAAAAVGY